MFYRLKVFHIVKYMLKRKDINELFIENVNHLLSTKTFRNRREIVDKFGMG